MVFVVCRTEEEPRFAREVDEEEGEKEENEEPMSDPSENDEPEGSFSFIIQFTIFHYLQK